MNVLTDELIDVVANLCWHYQGQQLKNGAEASCICHVLKDMVHLTRQEVAKEIDRMCDDECQFSPHKSTNKNIYYHNAHNEAADIARGTR